MNKVADVMTRDVEWVHPDDTLRACAEKMRALNVGPMPVCDGDRVVGVITDRDIVVRGIALGLDPVSARVREAMTPEVSYCKPDTSIGEAARIMGEKQIRRLLVIGENKRLVGIISLGDLSQEASDRVAGAALEEISEPSAPAH
jgi:CBS domain-containing protein